MPLPEGFKFETPPSSGLNLPQGFKLEQENIPIPDPQRGWLDIPGEALSNALPSAGKLVTGVGQMIAHPVDLASGIGNIARGAIYKALPQSMLDQGSQQEVIKDSIAAANNAGGHFKDRYGSIEAIKKTLATDPVGALADLSMLFGGAAGIVRGVGKAIPAAASTAEAVAAPLTKAATYTNPLTPVQNYLLNPALKYGAKGVGAVADIVRGRASQVNAANIAREAAGPNLNAIRSANEVAPEGTTAGQAAYGIDQDMYQSLADLAAGKDKSNYYRVASDIQNQNRLNELANAAGGANQAEALAGRIKTKETLNALTKPMRETELAAADTAGKLGTEFQKQIEGYLQTASDKVQDVRRFVPAGKRISDLLDSPISENVKYLLQLEQRAGQVVDQAAAGSLAAGDATRFKQMQMDSLAAHGLEPLTSDSLVSHIRELLRKPENQIKDLNKEVLSTVSQKIQEWTDKGTGVIDANALYEIRKSAINSAIDKLAPTLDAKSRAREAAGLLTQVKPLIDEAIIKAGGTQWNNYLKTFESGMQKINTQKMAAKAMEMYQDSPNSFLKLVQGNDVKVIEKVFGPGSYDIIKEMGAQFEPLRKAAGEVQRDIALSEQAKAGAGGLLEVLKSNQSKFRIPAFFSPKVTIANEALRIFEGKVNAKTMQVISEGMKTGKSANEMMSVLPSVEQNKVLRYLKSNPQLLVHPGALASARVVNALSPDNESFNSLND